MKKLFLTFLCLYSFVVFSQNKEIEKLINCSDSLETTENYKIALNFWKKNQSKAPQLSKHYITYFTYWNDTENQSFNQIIGVEKALLKIPKRDELETNLLLKVFSNHYHHIAENGDWEKTLEKALEGYAIKDFNQAKLETRTDYLYDLGYLYDKVGNSFEGIKFYKKSLALYIKQFGENTTDVALNYNNLAYAYANVYNQKNTIAYYEKAAKIWEIVYKYTIDNKDYLVTVYHNLVYQYINYGDLEKAQINLTKLNNYFFTKYKTTESKKELRYFLSFSDFCLSNIRLNLALNKKENALKILRDFEENQFLPYQKAEHSKYLMQCYQEIADFLIDNNDCETALKLIQKALPLANKYEQNFYLVTLNSKLAAIYKCQNKNDLAIKFYEIAQNNTKTYFNSSKYTLEFLKAEVYYKSNQEKLAISNIKKNIEQLLFDLSKKKKNIDKLIFSDVKELVSTEFINLFYKSGQLYFQNYKKFKNKNDLKIADNLYKISNKLFKEYYLKGEYNEELNKYHTEIIEGLLEISLEKKLTSIDKINLINDIERSASQHLAKEFFKKIKTKNNLENVNLERIKDLKSELNYYKSQLTTDNKRAVENNKKIVAIEQAITALQHKTSKTNQEIDKNSLDNFDVLKVQKALNSVELVVKYYTLKNNVYALYISSKHIEIKKIATTTYLKKEVLHFLQKTKQIDQNSISVSKSLSKILWKGLNYKKITFIRDGILNYLPFETLYNAESKKYLVENSNVSYDYTLPLFLFNSQNNIVVDSNNLIAFAPNYKNKNTATVRSGLSDLQYAKKEAHLISKLFNGTSFINEQATKNNFFTTINQYGFYHFAMHSLVDENNINKSCLVFSNNEKLYFSELYGMNFPAKLVVLSACDTGNGFLKSGEGIMSISRALTHAGVHSTVMSLWQVPDKETSEIMILFYKNLKKGQSKDEALANAKTTFIKNNPMKNHPFYWAGFIVTGDVSPITTTNYWGWITAFLAATALFLLFYYRKKLLQFFK
jgi:CHAT domain-containing protein